MLRVTTRRLPIGAELTADGIHFRVWAPRCRRVQVEFHCLRSPADKSMLELTLESAGYFSGLAVDAAAGMLYGLRLDGSTSLWPDPASRFQPAGPRGLSQVVDPQSYAWRDAAWKGVLPTDQVLYEMHIGTFTPEGTWQAAAGHLADLATLGITALEIMPIAEFAGNFGWGYDGVNLFAPYQCYGTPDDLRAFADEAHRVGIGVILDVVYNHLSRVGERLLEPFSEHYVSRRYKNDWGAAINFDGEQSAAVREYFLANAGYWISEYHFDGLRIDATQAFHDDSERHILLDLCREARRAAGDRPVWLVGENEPQRAELLRPADEGGFEFDALWNDDFHHAAMVRLTGRREAYYTDYQGSAEEFIAAAKWGFLFQGQRYAWQGKPRGTPALDVAAPRFLHFIQNHDQLANSARGARIHELTSPGRYRAMTALLLLAPQTPLLLQGQEFAASSPFLYFNDCEEGEAEAVRRGRADFLAQFPSLANMLSELPDPCDAANFQASKLDWSERANHSQALALHRDLLRLRRDDPVIAEHDADRVHGATLGPDELLLRFLGSSGQTRLLLVNFGGDLRSPSIAQPLVAPPAAMRWATLWSSEDPCYGGSGIHDVETGDGWHIPGEAAILLQPTQDQPAP